MKAVLVTLTALSLPFAALAGISEATQAKVQEAVMADSKVQSLLPQVPDESGLGYVGTLSLSQKGSIINVVVISAPTTVDKDGNETSRGEAACFDVVVDTKKDYEVKVLSEEVRKCTTEEEAKLK